MHANYSQLRVFLLKLTKSSIVLNPKNSSSHLGGLLRLRSNGNASEH